MPYPNGRDHMTEAHEERIQRLESSMQEVVASTTGTSVKVDHLVTMVKEGFASINARLDQGADQFKKHEADIGAIKAENQARAKRWATVKAAVLPLLAAAAAVVATKFGESVWTFLSALF